MTKVYQIFTINNKYQLL